MGWVSRKGKSYYYETRRVGGRPVKAYRGSGPAAEAAAAEVDQRRKERVERAKSLMTDEAAHAAASAPLVELEGLTDLLVRASLTLAGYRQHDRGEWRRRRHNQEGQHDDEFNQARSGRNAGDPGSGPPR